MTHPGRSRETGKTRSPGPASPGHLRPFHRTPTPDTATLNIVANSMQPQYPGWPDSQGSGGNPYPGQQPAPWHQPMPSQGQQPPSQGFPSAPRRPAPSPWQPPQAPAQHSPHQGPTQPQTSPRSSLPRGPRRSRPAPPAFRPPPRPVFVRTPATPRVFVQRLRVFKQCSSPRRPSFPVVTSHTRHRPNVAQPGCWWPCSALSLF